LHFSLQIPTAEGTGGFSERNQPKSSKFTQTGGIAKIMYRIANFSFSSRSAKRLQIASNWRYCKNLVKYCQFFLLNEIC
jgi:hypothetical protein